MQVRQAERGPWCEAIVTRISQHKPTMKHRHTWFTADFTVLLIKRRRGHLQPEWPPAGITKQQTPEGRLPWLRLGRQTSRLRHLNTLDACLIQELGRLGTDKTTVLAIADSQVNYATLDTRTCTNRSGEEVWTVSLLIPMLVCLQGPCSARLSHV